MKFHHAEIYFKFTLNIMLSYLQNISKKQNFFFCKITKRDLNKNISKNQYPTILKECFVYNFSAAGDSMIKICVLIYQGFSHL